MRLGNDINIAQHWYSNYKANGSDRQDFNMISA